MHGVVIPVDFSLHAFGITFSVVASDRIPGLISARPDVLYVGGVERGQSGPFWSTTKASSSIESLNETVPVLRIRNWMLALSALALITDPATDH
jgi:hypothetical protein